MARGEFGLCLIAESIRQDRERKRLLSPTPMYTADEIKQLARESIEQSDTTNDDKIIMRLVLSRFLAWLAKREQGKENG